MRPSPLARFVLYGFIAIFVVAAAYLLLDALGLWTRLPGSLTRAVEIGTGAILLFTLVAHLALTTGPLPLDDTRARPRG
jgi:putative flippase GtrA